MRLIVVLAYCVEVGLIGCIDVYAEAHCWGKNVCSVTVTTRGIVAGVQCTHANQLLNYPCAFTAADPAGEEANGEERINFLTIHVPSLLLTQLGKRPMVKSKSTS